eukprot:jgi/Botrbrau1/16104/Bobra.7_2s0069.1
MAGTFLEAKVANCARVIVHLDLDCFYCQVEQKRLGIPTSIPVAVQQWEGLIAVNYAARAAGITRHMRVGEARQKCPELRTVHVETIGGNGSALDEEQGQQAADRSSQKACLNRYRRASSEIIAVLHSVCPQAPLEKASIDEVYMDVTAEVDQELQERGAAGITDEALAGFSFNSVVLEGPLDIGSEFERRLAVGAGLACRLRGAVFQQLGYTMSGGIASNKLLAKIGSGMHKPNQQTVVPPRAVLGLMKDLPLRKLRNFGGKLGEELQALGCATAGQVAELPKQELEAHFGSQRAAAILASVNGLSNDPVQARERPKSLLVAKSFEQTSKRETVHKWMGVLAEELSIRLIDDAAQFERHPRTFTLYYRSNGRDRSRSGPMPFFGRGGPTVASVAAAGCAVFDKCADGLPCSRVAIAASNFEAGAYSNEQGAITRFFAPGVAGPSQAAPAPCSLPHRAREAKITDLFQRAAAQAKSGNAGTPSAGTAGLLQTTAGQNPFPVVAKPGNPHPAPGTAPIPSFQGCSPRDQSAAESGNELVPLGLRTTPCTQTAKTGGPEPSAYLGNPETPPHQQTLPIDGPGQRRYAGPGPASGGTNCPSPNLYAGAGAAPGGTNPPSLRGSTGTGAASGGTNPPTLRRYSGSGATLGGTDPLSPQRGLSPKRDSEKALRAGVAGVPAECKTHTRQVPAVLPTGDSPVVMATGVFADFGLDSPRHVLEDGLLLEATPSLPGSPTGPAGPPLQGVPEGTGGVVGAELQEAAPGSGSAVPISGDPWAFLDDGGPSVSGQGPDPLWGPAPPGDPGMAVALSRPSPCSDRGCQPLASPERDGEAGGQKPQGGGHVTHVALDAGEVGLEPGQVTSGACDSAVLRGTATVKLGRSCSGNPLVRGEAERGPVLQRMALTGGPAGQRPVGDTGGSGASLGNISVRGNPDGYMAVRGKTEEAPPYRGDPHGDRAMTGYSCGDPAERSGLQGSTRTEAGDLRGNPVVVGDLRGDRTVGRDPQGDPAAVAELQELTTSQGGGLHGDPGGDWLSNSALRGNSPEDTAVRGDWKEGDPAGKDESGPCGVEELDPLLQGVDLQEQRRIMHEIWMQNNLSREAKLKRPGSVVRAGAGGPKKRGRRTDGGRQLQISGLLAKKHP